MVQLQQLVLPVHLQQPARAAQTQQNVQLVPLQLLVHLVHLQQLEPLEHLRGVFKTIELFPGRELHHVPLTF